MVKKILKIAGIVFIILFLIAGYFIYQVGAQFSKLGNTTLVSNIDSLSIPFTYSSSGHILIPVKVEGSDNSYPFILDSGAPNFIFSHHVDEFDLETNGRGIGMGSRGNFYISNIRKIDSIKIGGMIFKDLHAKEMEFNFSCSDEIYGIIGKGTMRNLVWQIDFKNQVITMAKSSKFLSFGQKKIEIPLSENKKSHHLYSSIKLKNARRAKDVIVDLGSNGTLSLNEKYILRDSLDLQYRIIDGKASKGLGGSSKSTMKEKYYLSDLLFFQKSNFSIKNMIIATSPTGLDLLGLGFLKNFKTTINWQDKLLTLEPYDSVQNYIWKSAGFSVKFDDEVNKVVIGTLIQGTQADNKNLPLNAEVLSINEFNFTDEQSYCIYRNRKSSSDTLKVKIKDNDAIKTYEFITEQLFDLSNMELN